MDVVSLRDALKSLERKFEFIMTVRFPRLPMLTRLADRHKEGLEHLFSKTFFVCFQHLLESTGSLLETLIELGAEPSNFIVLGKSYSTGRGIANTLVSEGINTYPGTVPCRHYEYSKCLSEDVALVWLTVCETLKSNDCVENVVVLDDGGHGISTIPLEILNNFKVVAVEQTTSGIRRVENRPPCPVINVARSAIKKQFESKLVAAEIIKRILPWCHSSISSRTIGIAGMGNIGIALAQELLSIGLTPSYYDPSTQMSITMCRRCDSVKELVASCDVILGCSGVDIFADQFWINDIIGNKVLISCSSEDREFYSVLRSAQDRKSDTLSNVTIKLSHGKLLILRGGFPVNFDDSGISVPNEKIQLTRALLLAGILQALHYIRSSKMSSHDLILQLSPDLQAEILADWMSYTEESSCVISQMNVHSLNEYSEGHSLLNVCGSSGCV